MPEDYKPTFADPGRVGNPAYGRWMEICSISRRIDFPQKAKFQTKKKIVEKDLLVLEISIGLDRCVFNFEQGEKRYGTQV